MEEAHTAITTSNIPLLQAKIREVGDINGVMEGGETLLHIAAQMKNPFMIQLLINKRADVHAKNELGYTPLYYAIQVDHAPSIQLLLRQKSNLETIDVSGSLPIHHAVKCNAENAIQVILQKSAKQRRLINVNGQTPFHTAAEYGHLQMAKLLLENDVSVNEISCGDEWTALHFAANHGELAMTKFLLESSADVNIANADFKKAIDLAKSNEHENIVKLLRKEQKKSTNDSPRGSPRDSSRRKKRDGPEGTKGIALYPFSCILLPDLIEEGDLEFEENQVITDIVKTHVDWWEGSIGEKRGLFPACFISNKCIMFAKVTYGYEAQRDDEISLEKGDKIRVFEENENGWARVAYKEKGGWFPVSRLEKVNPIRIQTRMTKSMSERVVKRNSSGKSSPKKRSKSKSRTPLSKSVSSTPTFGRQAKVIKKYEPQHPGDLELTVDSIIELTKMKGAWWEGSFEGNKGIFPAKCVETLE